MGGSASSRPALDYEVATHRLGYAEVAKIEEGFARLAVGGRLRRSEFRTGFLNSIAGAPVPEAFASALFDGFDTTASNHITVKEFICSFAVLRCGTPEERLRLLFTVYDADRDQRLSHRELERFVHALEDGRAGATRERAIDDALKALAAAGPSVGFERFAQWAREHMDSPLIDWVFDMGQKLETELRGGPGGAPPLPGAAADLMRPLERSLSAEDREDQHELLALSEALSLQVDLAAELRTAWRLVALGSQFGVVDAEAFLSALRSAPRELAARLFRALDMTKSGTVSMPEWTQGLSVCLMGSPEARLQLCLDLFAGEEMEDGIVVPAAAAEELRRFGEGCITLFVESPCSRQRQRSPPSPVAEREPAGLTREQAAGEPWASRMEAVVRAVGHLARVDLGLQPRDPHEEREIVDRVSAKFDPERPGNVGDTWYLISARWWQQWCESTGASTRSRRQDTPSIDNSGLVDHGSLRIGLNHPVDYEVITEAAWRALQAWYGGPGPPLPRQVVDLDGHYELEMYPLRLHVNRTDLAGDVLLLERVMEISRATLLVEVMRLACELHGISDPVTLYHRSSPNIEWEEGDEGRSLHELGFIDGHRVLLRLQGRLPAVPPSPSGTNSPGSRGLPSLVGLQNLGNTCYMNASLQCLIHTPLLPGYFNVEYRFDLNIEGNWGMAGKLAVAFAELLSDAESARLQGSRVIAPRAFRRVIGEFRPQFAGWKQQDAQEFLSVFLAGLSEDVNRTRAKPYVELKDSAGRPDREVAQEFWSAHRRREQSVVAALFSSQFKSVLRCTICGHDNAAFDPFSFLPVPLPEHDFRWVTSSVVSVPRVGSPDQHTVQVCTRVPKRGHVSDLLQAIAGLTGFRVADLVAADVAGGYVFRLLDHGQALSSLSDDFRPLVFHAPSPQLGSPTGDVVSASEAGSAGPPAPPPAPTLPVPSRQGALAEDGCGGTAEVGGADRSEVLVYLVHRRLCRVERYFLNPYKSEVFGTPALLRLPARCTAAELYAAAFRLVRHFVPDFEPREGQWPFSLSMVKRDGTACADCWWRQGCLGCKVPVGRDAPPVCLQAESTLGIDWDAQLLEKHFKFKIAAHVHAHESVELARIERDTPERLAQCLDGLVREEELTAYCRKCTQQAGDYTETLHTKALRIWACGPLLVLQLKRFHSSQGASYKLHNLITFPTRLDLRDYLAEVPKEATCSTAASPTSTPTAGSGSEGEPARKSARGPSASPCGSEPSAEAMLNTLSREVLEYELYGVVNHIGGMGSGHYTAFVRQGQGCGGAGSRGRWFCCNDDGVYALSEEDIVTANAYLLFYARADVAAGEVGLHDVFPTHGAKTAAALDPEEVKRKKWVRPTSIESRTASAVQMGSSGFCGVM